jgi:hypothetical protein
MSEPLGQIVWPIWFGGHQKKETALLQSSVLQLHEKYQGFCSPDGVFYESGQ